MLHAYALTIATGRAAITLRVASVRKTPFVVAFVMGTPTFAGKGIVVPVNGWT
jgi:hypothetical protein